MLILKDSDVSGLVSGISADECRELLRSLEQTLREYGRSRADDPSKQLFHQPLREVMETTAGSTHLFMPCSVTASTGIKVVTVSPAGLKGCVSVFAPTGELLGLLNSETLTAFRTSLAVMSPYVRYRGAKTNVVVFGAGNQAAWHISLSLLLGDGAVRKVTVVNRSRPGRLEALFERLGGKHPGVEFSCLLTTSADYDAQLQSTLAGSDVIFGCAPSTKPHFPFAYLSKDKSRFISLIGSYKPSMHEIDTETLRSARPIYVDTKEGCLSEAGELITAGVKEDELVEVWDLEDGAPLESEGNTIFKCVGVGLMDLVVGKDMLQIATRKGLGVVVDDF